MDELHWTTKRVAPADNGYYACRRTSKSDEVMLCYVSNGHPLVVMFKGDHVKPEELLDYDDAEWLGPMTFPK